MAQALRILVCGDFGIGKSSFIARYIKNEWTGNPYPPNDDPVTKTVQYKGIDVKLTLKDMVGEQFGTSTSTAFRNVNGIIFMFDLTATSTLESVPNWIEEANRACTGVSSGDVPIFLAGNKSDAAERTVTEAAIQKVCAERNLPYTEISVKDNTNLDKLMDVVLSKMLKDVKVADPASNGAENANKGKATHIEEKKSGCCVMM